MTKGDLLSELESFADEQEVFVELHSLTWPEGAQIVIQGVVPVAPWRSGVPDLIGLIAHDQNAEVKPK